MMPEHKRAAGVVIDALEARQLFYAGDVLVSVSVDGIHDELRRYQLDGTLVGAVAVPDGGGRDLAIDYNNDVHQWVGTFNPELRSHRAPIGTAGGGWHFDASSATTPGWSTINRTFYGGVAIRGQYVFVTDQSTGSGGEANGLIRFQGGLGYAPTRFASGTDFSDVSVGNDGLLYAMNGGQSVQSQVFVFNATTLQLIRTVNVPGFDNACATADSAGNIYVGGTFEGKTWKLSPTGTVITSVDLLSKDLDISNDDQLLSSDGGTIRLFDTNLNVLASFAAGSFTGASFVAFANYQLPARYTGTVIGRLFNDLDGDGIQDPGEVPLKGRTVWSDRDRSGTLSYLDPVAVTNADGFYRLVLQEGLEYLRQVVPDGWSATYPVVKRTVTVVPGQILGGVNFGSRLNVIISGYVYHDSNRSKVRDPLESPLAGWQVYVDANDNGVLDLDEISVRTNNAGKYTFTTLAAGTYTIRIVQQAGWFRTTQPSFLMTLGPGEVAANRLFGQKRII